MSYLKLRELWNECEKLDLLEMGVFIGGLTEIANSAISRAQPAKHCVAQPTIREREKWTEAEEDLLHRCCQDVSVVQGVKLFLQKTGNKRTQGACELRANEMKRKGRW